MKNIPTNLFNEIKEGNICNVVKITLKNGTIFGYTDFDSNITINSVEYVATPGLQKVRMALTNNTEVSNQEIASAWVDAPEEDLMSGKFDSATINVGWASWKHPEYGIMTVFNGALGEISWTDAGFKADIFSQMKVLEQNIGDVFTANCRHVLFSEDGPRTIGACNVNDVDFTYTGLITSVIKARWEFNTSLSQPDEQCATGKITFTSGANVGLSYVVKSQTGGNIVLFLPTSYPVANGDTFLITAGCDKTISTCKNKFNNVINFGGFPHIQSDVNFR